MNENFFIEQAWTQKRLQEAVMEFDPRIYPPTYGSAARKAIAEFYDIPEERLLIENGALRIIDLLTTTFTHNSSCLVIMPTFGAYEKQAKKKGGNAINFLLNKNDFSLDLDALLEKIDETIKIIFIVSPNNPTGNQFPQEAIKTLLESTKVPVVVDEAYADFAPYSVLHWEYDNLIVVRSFSKTAATAGLRLGYVVADEALIEQIRENQSFLGVNAVAQYYIIKILENFDYIQQKKEKLKQERTHFFKQLQNIKGIQVYPSVTSFFLLRLHDVPAKTVVEQLKQDDILISDRSDEPLLDNCIRVSLGTRLMNTKFIEGIERALKQ